MCCDVVMREVDVRRWSRMLCTEVKIKRKREFISPALSSTIHCLISPSMSRSLPALHSSLIDLPSFIHFLPTPLSPSLPLSLSLSPSLSLILLSFPPFLYLPPTSFPSLPLQGSMKEREGRAAFSAQLALLGINQTFQTSDKDDVRVSLLEIGWKAKYVEILELNRPTDSVQ
jgi:hypothetical protein